MVAKNESSETSSTPARYWSGYDTLDDEIARVNSQLAERNGKSYRDGWWRFNMRNKVLGPLESAARFRRTDTHAPILNRHASGSPTEEQHCSCGLIVDLPVLPALVRNSERDKRKAVFLAAPGHLDWRRRGLDNNPVPRKKVGRRKEYWEFGMHIAIYGPPPGLDKLARQLGAHLPVRTEWPVNNGMPRRWCSCGLKVEAPDLIPLSDRHFETYARQTYWPNDPVEYKRIQRAFFNAKGHKKLRERETSDDGGVA